MSNFSKFGHHILDKAVHRYFPIQKLRGRVRIEANRAYEKQCINSTFLNATTGSRPRIVIAA